MNGKKTSMKMGMMLIGILDRVKQKGCFSRSRRRSGTLIQGWVKSDDSSYGGSGKGSSSIEGFGALPRWE